MATLHLLRHLKSSWDDPGMDDFERPLNARGLRDADTLAAAVATAGLAPGLVLCSSARRTRETLARVVPALAGDHRIELDSELYLAPADRILARLRRVPGEVAAVLVIGHNPGLHDLAVLLASAGPAESRRRLAEKFPTGSLATIEAPGPWVDLRPGSGRLVAFFRPRDGE